MIKESEMLKKEIIDKIAGIVVNAHNDENRSSKNLKKYQDMAEESLNKFLFHYFDREFLNNISSRIHGIDNKHEGYISISKLDEIIKQQISK